MSQSLAGRKALITGAGRGIGAAIATRLATEGAHVAVNDLDADTAKATVEKLRSAGAEATTVIGDIAEPDDARRIVAEAVSALGGLDILVNNAATGFRKKLRDVTDEDWTRTIAVNLNAPFFLTQAALDHLKASGSGAIVNICSTAVIGFFGQVAYDASKGGLLTLTRSLAVELGREGIRVNAICPGFIDTQAAASEDLGAIAEKQAKTQPIRRIGRPEEIANAVTFLVSDEASYVTGQALFVDGGWVRSS
jgi:3-oxoacyl-[acyl-carrier protein] reductase